jgi:tRNA-splicing ligase RtcB (3'-phosphate/5'-hydroxy nucleic acid ligase)
MDRRYTYRQKNVHDIPVGGITVRLWSTEGAQDRRLIKKAFEPLAQAGFVHPYLALMPDWHPGTGAVVGSVISTREVLLPTVVGGDIGCGVAAVRLPLTIFDLVPSIEAIGRRLRDVVPVGSAFNSVVSDRVKKYPLWDKELRARVSSRTLRKLVRQFGSMGGGNHFLEIQKDHEQQLWIMLHSGSRYLGVEVRDWYVQQGADQTGIDKRLYARIPHLIAGSPLASDYLLDMKLVMEFARESRREMMLRALEVIHDHAGQLDTTALVTQVIDIHHNYVDHEEHFGESLYIHRKGAVRLADGQLGSVPGSMGTASFIVQGRGNPYGFFSSAHGGGRRMSRAEAMRKVSRKDYQKSLEGVICAHSELLLDEAPEAYKDIRMVMRGQADLVKTLYELMPVLSVKGR